MHKGLATTVAVLLGAAAIAGCGDDDESTSDEGKAADVAYITYVYFDYQQVEEQGMNDSIKPDGGSVKVFNANFDPQKLQQQCTDVIQSGRYNAIALAPVDPASATPCVRAAREADIPVVTIEGVVGKDPDAIEPQVEGVVGAVALTVGASEKLYGQLVEKACEGKDPCKVIAEQSPGDPFTTAFVRGAEALPNVDVVARINTQFDPAKTAQLLPDAIAKHKDVDVFMGSQDENALAAVGIFKDAGVEGVAILGTGGSRRAAEAVADGTMFGTLGSWPLQMGELAGEMLVKAVNDESIDDPGVDATAIDEPQLVTKETVDEFEPEWGAK